MPEWDADTLPIGFRQKHNTREGTWARLVVLAGNLKFTFLTEEGEEVSSQIIDAHSGPQLVEPLEPRDLAWRYKCCEHT